MQLQDKTAIVTGGASGFGAGIAEHFAAAGARVLLTDRDAERGAATANELDASTAGEVSFMPVDVTDQAQVQAAVAQVIERHGHLDILVNNAGIGQRPVALEDTSDAIYDALYDINVRGVFIGCRAALPVMKARRAGVIINTASGIALTPRPNLVTYAATKGAVVTFTKGLAMELAEFGIRVNALCPAAGDTPMLAEFMGGQDTAENRAKYMAGIPLGKLVTGDDMGAAATYLASDAAGMITGTCLAVDGGRCI